MDQRWLIDLAAQRQPYICQGQSLNLFFPADVHKKYFHQVHTRAWEKGIKSLYYVRSQSIQRAESRFTKENKNNSPGEQYWSEECLSCQ
jgi:ribonucleoside-diphosphate reductase alpha chain